MFSDGQLHCERDFIFFSQQCSGNCTGHVLPKMFVRACMMAVPKIGSVYFEDMNFVQGFERPGCWSVVEDVHPHILGLWG